MLEGWEFSRDGKSWESVRIPHDWAIGGPFDRTNDLQHVMIVQDGERVARDHTGRTGGLPWVGEGWYRRKVELPADAREADMLFEGAMSQPEVFSDGMKIGEAKWGYAPFSVTLPVKPVQTVIVKLSNLPCSSRWYPGAGIYRPVTLRVNPKFKVEDVFVWTERIEPGKAHMRVRTPNGERSFTIDNPKLWSPETPHLYTLEPEGIRYGVRTVTWTDGCFRLNGVKRKFKGVCLHHDLGPLGAAFNEAAFRRQIRLLKSMGCDSIRTAHNMPSRLQLSICDEEGMMVMAESFDEWRKPKCRNGYNLFFDDWWRKDLEMLVRFCRNHPSVVMWSIGNEVNEQFDPAALTLCREMQELCHRFDHTRPVTQGLDRLRAALDNGFVSEMDVPGLNYRLQFYGESWTNSRHRIVIGSETASTVSSRGVYKFPVIETMGATWDDGHCCSYDLGCCPWSNLPDDDFAVQDDNPWTIGEFVWTGFDYLGEPTPYKEYWPSRSSYFGIFDLAGIPKDRYWLYRSRWNEKSSTLHLLPHWTWPGREGKVTPVYCYTSYPSAELFVNGKSKGRRAKNPSSRLDRYRLRWNDVVYEPGELRVVAYDAKGICVDERVVRTAGKPSRLEVSADRLNLKASSDKTTPDMAFVEVRIVDEKGNLCPEAANRLSFSAEGSVRFNSVCNGDQTSLESFVRPSMKAFNGRLVAVVEALGEGSGRLCATAEGLDSATVVFSVR